MQQGHLLQRLQLLPELHLQHVAPTVPPLQVLDGADAPDGGARRQLDAGGGKLTWLKTNLSWPETTKATRSHTASASSMWCVVITAPRWRFLKAARMALLGDTSVFRRTGW